MAIGTGIADGFNMKADLIIFSYPTKVAFKFIAARKFTVSIH